MSDAAELRDRIAEVEPDADTLRSHRRERERDAAKAIDGLAQGSFCQSRWLKGVPSAAFRAVRHARIEVVNLVY